MTKAISGIVLLDSEIGFTEAKLELSQEPPMPKSVNRPRANNINDVQRNGFEVIIFSMAFHGLNLVIDFAFATAIVIKLAVTNWIPTVKETSANRDV